MSRAAFFRCQPRCRGAIEGWRKPKPIDPAVQVLVALPFLKPKKGLMTVKRLSTGPAAAYAASVCVTTSIDATSGRQPSRSGKVLIRSVLRVYIAVDSPESELNAGNWLDSWSFVSDRRGRGSGCQAGDYRCAPGS